VSPGLHLAYLGGNTTGKDPQGRSGVDFGIAGLVPLSKSGGGGENPVAWLTRSESGLVVGISGVAGLSSPSYAAVEGGGGWVSFVTGAVATVGPVVRLDDLGLGVGGRLAFDLFLLELGVRIIVVPLRGSGGTAEGVVAGTIGLGRF
jgi:hypothetical protein